MSDKNSGKTPTGIAAKIRQVLSPSAPSVVPSGPPPASDAPPAGADQPQADAGQLAEPGAVAPPAAVDIVESEPVPAGTPTSKLVETPTQGAAAAAGEPIPPPDAEPLKTLAEVAPALAAAIAEDEIGEHPHVVLDRMRTKLGAYGAECVKTVLPEIQYLMSLCDPPGE